MRASVTVRVSFTVSGGHVRFMVSRGEDFDALVRASKGVIEFTGDTERAVMRLVRLMPRTARENAIERVRADRPRAGAEEADALASARDGPSAGDDGGAMTAYRRREERVVAGAKNPSPEKAAKAKSKMTRRAPVPASPDAFIRSPSRAELMSGGRPVSSLSRGGC
jgi:hypothetical protein